MRYPEVLRQLSSGIDAVIDLLEFLAQLTHTTRDDDAAALMSTVHKAIVGALSGLHGHVSPDDIRDHLARLVSELAANDAAIDTELDRKFRDQS